MTCPAKTIVSLLVVLQSARSGYAQDSTQKANADRTPFTATIAGVNLQTTFQEFVAAHPEFRQQNSLPHRTICTGTLGGWERVEVVFVGPAGAMLAANFHSKSDPLPDPKIYRDSFVKHFGAPTFERTSRNDYGDVYVVYYWGSDAGKLRDGTYTGWFTQRLTLTVQTARGATFGYPWIGPFEHKQFRHPKGFRISANLVDIKLGYRYPPDSIP